MKPHIILSSAFLLTACALHGPDPCAENNPLAPPGSQVYENCLECPELHGKACPAGETGGDEPVGPLVSCPVGDHSVCFNGDVVEHLDIPGGVEVVDSTTCPNLSKSFSANRHWSDYGGISGTYHAVFCDIDDGNADDPRLIGQAHDFAGAWPVCPSAQGPATMPTVAVAGVGPWWNRLSCPGEIHECEPIHLRYDENPWTYSPSASITCACPEHTDGECAGGDMEWSVCEGRYVANDEHGHHGLTKPTVCSWDGAHGRSRPHLPPSEPWTPEHAYLDADSLSLSPDTFYWLTWGEFDRFDASLATDSTGEVIGFELERVDPDSLPAYLGIDVGDVVAFDQTDIDGLARGEHVDIEIIGDTGTEVLDVVVEAR